MKYVLSLYSVAWLLFLGNVGEADPALTILDVLKLFYDFFLSVAVSLDCFPEADELVLVNLTVRVGINLVEELLSRDSAEGTLPVSHSFLFVDLLATIDVEDSEHFVHFLHAFSTQGTIALNDKNKH